MGNEEWIISHMQREIRIRDEEIAKLKMQLDELVALVGRLMGARSNYKSANRDYSPANEDDEERENRRWLDRIYGDKEKQ